MKIGILTFHRARNYGAVLQCYGLMSYLTSLGHEVEVVDYYPQVFKELYAQFPWSTFRTASFLGKLHTLEIYLTHLPISVRRRKIFDTFIHDRLNLSEKKYDDQNNRIVGYDVLFFGSDQIWNPKLTNGFDDVFTGNINSLHSKLVAYAASTNLGKNDKDDSELAVSYKAILSRFDSVSVREQAFADYLNSFQIKNVTKVLDPVFLLTIDQWRQIAVTPKEKDYLLIYNVPANEAIGCKAREIAKKKGLKVIELLSQERITFDPSKKQIVSPEEFVGYFLKASFVVTSSFHGTAFSVCFQKQFVTLLKGNVMDGRAYNLLKEIGLIECAISLTEDVNDDLINYDKVNNRLLKLVNDSALFIQESL